MSAGMRRASASRPLPPPMWRVEVQGHRLQRWTIEAHVLEVPAVDAAHACEVVVGILHRAAGVPPWKPLIRESLEHASAAAVDRRRT